ncbi:glycosyltransferase [Tepidimonas taiwanensis]|uniref:glycosyltransferase family 2 protein n=1 Tax=Tepidimonas taiwanensis TaxID=307486 RepID=UPI0009DCA726|nr:glycosyltransferase [Tepidimonas taiwanensis]UBQ04949.1 glycosyltransferase [Tepidimonas taiwanensis]
MSTSSSPVWVVVPVYRGLEAVQRCLQSVTAAQNRVPWRLLVIDDASPEPALRDWLQAWRTQQSGRVLVQRNARNLGFVRTANKGLALAMAEGADVVLLNSDTQVAHGWLDRLHAAAHRADDIGTTTPWSNNATIFSYPAYPEGGELPAGFDVHRMDALCAQTLRAQAVDVPTAHGFCMYIRSPCLIQTGLFDADAFGRGYGEENDFCLRASALGWRHVHALDVYVQHEGSVSFGAERAALVAHAAGVIRARYPDYDERIQAYLRTDPTAAARQALDAALASWRGGANTPTEDRVDAPRAARWQRWLRCVRWGRSGSQP